MMGLTSLENAAAVYGLYGFFTSLSGDVKNLGFPEKSHQLYGTILESRGLIE